MSEDMKIRTACTSIVPAEGYVMDLHGVQSITWDETSGIRIEFIPGGGPIVYRRTKWLPTEGIEVVP